MKIGNHTYEEWVRHRSAVFVEDKKGAMCISDDLIEFFIEKMENKQTYLEIGTFDGIALSIIAERYPDKEFHAIDAFRNGTGTGGGCMGYFIDNNHHLKNVTLFVGTTDEIRLDKDFKLDVAFIDGDHSYEWTWKDFNKMYPLMNDGGIIAFHDYPMEGVKKAVDEICVQYGFKLIREPSCMWVEVSK